MKIIRPRRKVILLILCFFMLIDYNHAQGSLSDVYIDPQNVDDTNTDGSYHHPYNSFGDIKFESGKTYHLKRSTELWLSEKIEIRNLSDITFKAYGKGKIPVIHAGQVSKPFDIANSQYIKIKNIHIHGGDRSIYCLRIKGNSREISIHNCSFSNAMWGLRIMGVKEGIQHQNIRVTHSSIYNIGDDGIFAQNVSKLEIDSCDIRKVNQKWLHPGGSKTSATGDGIQLLNCSDVVISRCLIDRTDTGNKFCVIFTHSENGKIIDNKLSGPVSSDYGGAAIYLGGHCDSMEVSHNRIEHAPAGIYSHAKNVLLYRNIVTENDLGMWANGNQKKLLINNTFWNNTIALNASNIRMYNNIFYSEQSKHAMLNIKAPFSSDYNCYFTNKSSPVFERYGSLFWFAKKTGEDSHSFFMDPLIEKHSNDEFVLKPNSPCIDKGTHNELFIGAYQTSYCGKKVDIGAIEFCEEK